jgi:hypothetical protein
MINWAKPILINGAHETFKLAGTLDGFQLVITTSGPQGTQTLFKVYDSDGSSVRLEPYAGGRNVEGPTFSNEPELVTMTSECFMNINSDGTWYSYRDGNAANAPQICHPKRVACLKICITVNPKTGEFESGMIGKA